MPQNFLQNHQLYLTPLSPLHLGTGEDYEPTNYVISDGALYAFDPSQAALTPQQRNELLQTAQRGDTLAIQNYFKKHGSTFADCAYKIVGVSSALASEYEKLGKVANREQSGQKVGNSFIIERTAVNPVNHQPYIPGSALKGCLRTAWLDQLAEKQPYSKGSHKQNNAAHYETELLGSFASDGLRLLKTADFTANGTIATQIQYAVNKKKHIVYKRDIDGVFVLDGNGNKIIVQAKGVTGRRETIQHGQYRAFGGSCTLQKLLLAHNPPIKQPNASLPKTPLQNLQQIAQNANHYHLKRFEAENRLLDERGLIHPEWLQHTRNLLAALKQQLDNGEIMLVRLGKHGGAESKTLSGLAQIKINEGKDPETDRQRSSFQQHTQTVWLAAQAATETHGLLPFGWALVEIDPQGGNAALQNWCQQNSSHLNDIQALQAKLHERKQAAAAQKAAIRAEAEAAERAKIEQAAAEQAAAAAHAAELAAMKPADRLIADWTQKLRDFPFDPRNDTASNVFFNQLKTAWEQATAEMDDNSKQQIATAFSFKKLENLKRGFFINKREKEIKAMLKQLRGE